jgi:hypothetical protein
MNSPIVKAMVTLNDLAAAAMGRNPWAAGGRYDFTVKPNDHAATTDKPDRWATFEASAASGKSYLVGDNLTMAQYLKRYASALSPWLRLAYQWALENPTQMLIADNHKSREYYIARRGDYVEISLPHHDMGGEKTWISRDGETRLLINED